MRPLSLKAIALGSTAIGLTLGVVGSAQADTFLSVTNLTFTDYSGPAPKNYFSTVDPSGWYRGPVISDDLVFIDAPGTATVQGGGQNSYPVYGPFANPPPGGNFVQADGNPSFESTFDQNITGLVPGETYTLSFWQAAGQQQSFSGATTEQWIVSLGTSPLTVTVKGSGGTGTGTYANTDPNATVVASTLMNTPSQGTSPWQLVTLSLTADAATDVLSFLAWGDGGSTENEPPTVFLAGVNSPALPEPVSLSLFGVGLVGLGGVVRRRRGKRDTKA
ncbi:PEP-CTERM sorting domain-containing protein [Acidisphaera sp. S103]|uniref:PEP-CTERM sorting domain-containing protein n=1 Tax=Acidisphaera sp. S103 TaxID=1747223 RepID=UPI00131BD6AC|nr:PEP-CTERM sorting domain-containing protein [Acidisphaera sp. S103]